ncbi:receptor-type tyrosine-protein phosphatase C-like [Argonauta hians]
MKTLPAYIMVVFFIIKYCQSASINSSTVVFTNSSRSLETMLFNTTKEIELSNITNQMGLYSTTEKMGLNSTIDQMGLNYTTDQIRLNYTTDQMRLNYTTDQMRLNYTTDQMRLNYTTDQMRLNYTTDQMRLNYTTDQTRLNYTTDQMELNYTTEQMTSENVTGMNPQTISFSKYELTTVVSDTPDISNETTSHVTVETSSIGNTETTMTSNQNSTEFSKIKPSQSTSRSLNTTSEKEDSFWWLYLIIAFLLLGIGIVSFFIFYIVYWKNRSSDFIKLRPIKSPTYRRPYKIKNFLKIEQRIFINDYTTLGKVNPFILTEETNLDSSKRFLPCSEAQKLGNKKKNRFLNILPFDHSRVKIEFIDDDPYSDYINANYINGYNQEKEYIACQGPLINTVDDFWRMVWKENINLIVMLTLCKEKGKAKCYPYWPKKEKLKVITRDILLETDTIKTHEYYTESDIIVNLDDEIRTVKHLHFLNWPDFTASIDPTVLINFITTIRSHITQTPILIHCSAGVGRTGTLIAIDYMLQYVRDHNIDDDIDIFSFVYQMRENRSQMVQNQGQYLLINNCTRKAIMEKFKLDDPLVDINTEEIDGETDLATDIGTETTVNTPIKMENNIQDSSAKKSAEDIVLVNEVANTVEREADVMSNKDENDENIYENIIKDENVEDIELESTDDESEEENALSDAYTIEDIDVDENVPLTQKTSEL